MTQSGTVTPYTLRPIAPADLPTVTRLLTYRLDGTLDELDLLLTL